MLSWSRDVKSRLAAHTLTSVVLVGGSGCPKGSRPGDAPLIMRVKSRSSTGAAKSRLVVIVHHQASQRRRLAHVHTAAYHRLKGPGPTAQVTGE